MESKYIIINAPFVDWETKLLTNNKILYVNNKNKNKINIENYKIIAISVENYKLYNNLPNNIFNNNLENINILNNKSMFYEYGRNNFIEHIPEIYYLNYGNFTYINNPKTITNMIYKPNLACGSTGIKIINRLCRISNASITKYITHTMHYVGHFLVMNGQIINKVYFKSTNKPNEIKYGRIKNYEVEEKLTFGDNSVLADDSIFNKIFGLLNYSGFADSDFIEVDNKIIIFEINPRPGGSLIFNDEYFNKFLDNIINL